MLLLPRRMGFDQYGELSSLRIGDLGTFLGKETRQNALDKSSTADNSIILLVHDINALEIFYKGSVFNAHVKTHKHTIIIHHKIIIITITNLHLPPFLRSPFPLSLILPNIFFLPFHLQKGSCLLSVWRVSHAINWLKSDNNYISYYMGNKPQAKKPTLEDALIEMKINSKRVNRESAKAMKDSQTYMKKAK